MSTDCEIACEWALVTPPVLEPLDPDDAIRQARAMPDSEVTLFQSYIVAARQAAENHMARGLLTQTWKLVCSAFADVIWLPMAAPLQSITSVKYYNTDTPSVLTTLATTYYQANTTSRPGCVERAPGQSWPSVQADRRFPIEITYVVGWASADDVPERIKQGIRFHVAYLQYDREGMEEYGANSMKAAMCCWDDVVWWKPPAYTR